MEYENKYNEALKKASIACKKDEDNRALLEQIFPELKEPEDERIKKYLIMLLQHFCKGYRVPGLNFPVSFKDMLNWVEKHGRKEPQGKTALEAIKEEKADNDIKTESKFKVGDWIVSSKGKALHITDIKDSCYIFNNNESHFWIICYCNQKSHLWTIKDAKDGDILVTSDGNPFIYKGCFDSNHPTVPAAYCGIADGGYFCYCEDIDDWWTDGEVYPATEEQCKLLFRKMEGTGWEWDSENKKLIRL